MPAAGSGQRFAAKLPKQYAMLANKPVIEHSLEALLHSNIFAEIKVVLAKSDDHFNTLTVANDRRVTTCVGGPSRALSVLNGLLSLSAQAQPDDWVMVHDAARPLLDSASIIALYDALKAEAVGGILAIPVNDTLKQANVTAVSSGKPASEMLHTIAHTVDRSGIWAAQTPQMFRYKLLVDALTSALDSSSSNDITDEASALEKAGYGVKLVAGARSNIKITTAEDMALANYYVSIRQTMQRNTQKEQV